MRGSGLFLLSLTLALTPFQGSATSGNGLEPRLWTISQQGFPDVFASAHGGGFYVAAGNRGSIYTSSDGVTWTERVDPASPIGRDIRAISFGRGEFVAVGNALLTTGLSPLILTSPNGRIWTEHTAPGLTQSLFAVASGTTQYVAVGDGGHIVTSSNGILWLERPSGTAEPLNGVAWGGDVFVAVGENHTVLTSSDGATWTPQTAPPGMGASIKAVAYDGTQFVAVGSSQTIMTSPDGVTWTEQSVPDSIPTSSFYAVVVGNDTTVVVGDDRIYTSFDGVVWDVRSQEPPVPASGVGRFHRTVAFGPSGFVTLGLEGSVYTSVDGTSWVSTTDPASREWNDVAYGNGRFCAVGGSGSIASSSDGDAFTNRSGPSDFDLSANAIVWGEDPGLFVAVSGVNARIHVSSDCETFETVSHGDGFIPATGITGSFFDVTYGAEDGLFAAVGQEETGVGTGLFVPLVATSPDGFTWTQQDTGAPSDGVRFFGNVAYGAGRFVARGLNGEDGSSLLYTSEDGIAWVSHPAPFDNFEFIDDIVHTGDLFLAVGDRLWASIDGIHWAVRQDYDPYARVFRALAAGDGRFIAVREDGRIFSSDGVNLESKYGPTFRETRGIAFSEPLHRFVVVGESIIMRTDDPVLNFSPTSYTVTEGTLTQNLTVTRTGSLAGPVTVEYQTSDDTAFAGEDYTAKSTRLTLPGGKPSATITIPILNDSLDEPLDERFTVTLSNPSTGVFIGPSDVAEVTIKDNDQGGTIELGMASVDVTEGSGALKVKVPVTRTGTAPLAGDVSVTFSTFAGTALPGEDYTEVTKTLTFPAGAATVNAEVTVLPDDIDENDETFGVRIVAPSEGAELGDRTTALVKIIDKDAGGVFQFGASTYSGTEGAGTGQVLIKIQRTGGLAAASVTLAMGTSTATPGADFTLATGPIAFAPGQTMTTVPLTIVNDALGEPPETVTLDLQAPTGGASLGVRFETVVTIKDNEPSIQFALDAYTVAEGAGNVKVTVSRTPGPGPVTVDYGVTGGTAVSPADFGPASGSLSFASNELSKILTIPIVNDGEGEGAETFVLGLSNPGGASLGAHASTAVIIKDNEPAVQFALDAYTVPESAANVKVTVSRTAGPGPVTVDYGVIGGTAVSPADFGPASGSLSFATNELTKTLLIPIVNDGEGEGAETFVLGLSNPGGAYIGGNSSTTVTIKDNEPAVQFARPAYSVQESAGSVKVVVNRAPLGVPLTVDYGVIGGNASEPGDFGPVAGTLSFAANELTKTLTIPIVNDTEGEGNESFVLGLSNPGGASIGAQSSATVTVVDNEPSVKLSLASYPAVSEAVATHVAAFQVMRLGNAAVPFTVDYHTSDGTAEALQDYMPKSGTLSFAASQMSQSVNVSLIDDDVAEGSETIRVILENPVGASLGSVAEALLNVTSNDDPGVVVLDPGSASANEPDEGSSLLLPLTVKRTGKAPLAAISVAVFLAPSSSTATEGADFNFSPVTLDFGAGEIEKSFPLEILGDGVSCEDLETVVIGIQGQGPTPPAVSVGEAVVGIADRSPSFVGPLTAAGTLSTTGPIGTCTWQDNWTGTVVLNFACPNGTGNVATVRATRVLSQGVASGPGLACPSRSEPLLFTVPLEDDGTDFSGTVDGDPSVALEGSRSGSTAGGTLTFAFAGSSTGSSTGSFTAQKQ